MTASLTAQTRKPGFQHPYMTRSQARYIFDLINTRVGDADTDRLEAWKATYFAISSRAEFEHALTTLRDMPRIAAKISELASEEGLYLDPQTLRMYRLSRDSQGQLIVSNYSQTAARRIDAATGQEVKKGKWTRLGAWASRGYLEYGVANHTKILAEWFMTDDDKQEYVTGICNFCYRGLKDARSVRANCGPDCAELHGRPWGD